MYVCMYVYLCEKNSWNPPFFSQPLCATHRSDKAFAGRSGIRAFDEEARYFSFGPVPAFNQGSGPGSVMVGYDWEAWNCLRNIETWPQNMNFGWFLVLYQFSIIYFFAWIDIQRRCVLLEFSQTSEAAAGSIWRSVSSQMGSGSQLQLCLVSPYLACLQLGL